MREHRDRLLLAGCVALVVSAIAVRSIAIAAERWDRWSPIANARVEVWSEQAGAPRVSPRASVHAIVDRGPAQVAYVKPGERPTWSTGSADRPAIGIELSDTRVAPLQNRTSYPLAFPRPGVKKVLENDRVVVWDYTWTPGVPTPMHFHDKDVVVLYLEDGALRSTDPKGAAVINPHYFGFTKFNAGDRVHTEELTSGKARAIIVELK
jgi:hypothetical protein